MDVYVDIVFSVPTSQAHTQTNRPAGGGNTAGQQWQLGRRVVSVSVCVWDSEIVHMLKEHRYREGHLPIPPNQRWVE